LLWSEGSLNFVGIDDTRDVSIGQEWLGESVFQLLGRGLLVGAVEGIESLEGILGPDDEPSEVTTWSQVQEIQSSHGNQLNSGKIPEGSSQWRFLIVDDKWATSLCVTSIPHLTLSPSKLGGILRLLNVGECIEGLEEGDCL